jgi:beta-glucosidase
VAGPAVSRSVRAVALLLCLFAIFSAALRRREDDKRVAREVRIQQLISNMTLEEKARQLDLYQGIYFLRNGHYSEAATRARIDTKSAGAIHDLYPPSAHIINELQRYAKEKTRLGIPILFIEECLHGLGQSGHTVFPQSIALGATFDKDLVHRVGKAIAAEARAYGIGMCLSPVLGIAYEPRWGRTEELYGEDTYHVSRMAVAMVSGLQGISLATNHSVISEPKHFAAHSIPEGGLNTSPAHVGRRDLETLFLPTFRAAIMEAGAKAIMAAYSEIDGVPNAANHDLLTDHLRNEWGFEGFVLSDLGAVRMLWNTHRIAATPQQAILKYLHAGGNMQFYDFAHEEWDSTIIDAVKSGQLKEDLLDSRVADLLRVKLLLGLFDNPYTDENLVPLVVNSKPHQDLALRLQEKRLLFYLTKIMFCLYQRVFEH